KPKSRPSFSPTPTSLPIRHQEQNSQKTIHARENQIGAVRTRLRHQQEHRNRIAKLLDHRRNHQRAMPHRITRNNEKCLLPSQRPPDKSVIETWMSDRRRVFPSYRIKNKVKRGNDEQAPNPRHPEHNFREFHSSENLTQASPLSC